MAKSGLRRVTEQRKRHKQLGADLNWDLENNSKGQLVIAAGRLLDRSSGYYPQAPDGWNKERWKKMIEKEHEERIEISASLLVAELDRLEALRRREARKTQRKLKSTDAEQAKFVSMDFAAESESDKSAILSAYKVPSEMVDDDETKKQSFGPSPLLEFFKKKLPLLIFATVFFTSCVKPDGTVLVIGIDDIIGLSIGALILLFILFIVVTTWLRNLISKIRKRK